MIQTGRSFGIAQRVTLIFLTASSAFAVDVSLPALPSLSAALDVALSDAQRTIGIFLIRYGLRQIPAGVLSDRFGRRPVILVGMSLFVLAGWATALAMQCASYFGLFTAGP